MGERKGRERGRELGRGGRDGVRGGGRRGREGGGGGLGGGRGEGVFGEGGSLFGFCDGIRFFCLKKTKMRGKLNKIKFWWELYGFKPINIVIKSRVSLFV